MSEQMCKCGHGRHTHNIKADGMVHTGCCVIDCLCREFAPDPEPQMVRCPKWQEPGALATCYHALPHPQDRQCKITTIHDCPPCVPVDKEPVDEAMQKQHEQWVKDQEFYQQEEPAAPIENPYKDTFSINDKGEMCYTARDIWQEGYEACLAARHLPSVEEIERVLGTLKSVYFYGGIPFLHYKKAATAILSLFTGKKEE